MAVGWYVSIIRSATQRGLLLGPYPHKTAAELRIDDGRRLAVEADPFAEFDAFGVCRVERIGPLPKPVFNLDKLDLFG